MSKFSLKNTSIALSILFVGGVVLRKVKMAETKDTDPSTYRRLKDEQRSRKLKHLGLESELEMGDRTLCQCNVPKSRHAGIHPLVCKSCNLIIDAETFNAENQNKDYNAAKAFAERHNFRGSFESKDPSDSDSRRAEWWDGYFEKLGFECYIQGNYINLWSEQYDEWLDFKEDNPQPYEDSRPFFPISDDAPIYSKWDVAKTVAWAKRWADSHNIPYTKIDANTPEGGRLVSITNDECYISHTFVKPKTEEVFPNCKVCGIPNLDYVAPKPPEPICGVDMPHEWSEPKAIYTEDTDKELIMVIKSICANCDKRREVDFRKEWSADSEDSEPIEYFKNPQVLKKDGKDVALVDGSILDGSREDGTFGGVSIMSPLEGGNKQDGWYGPTTNLTYSPDGKLSSVEFPSGEVSDKWSNPEYFSAESFAASTRPYKSAWIVAKKGSKSFSVGQVGELRMYENGEILIYLDTNLMIPFYDNALAKAYLDRHFKVYPKRPYRELTVLMAEDDHDHDHEDIDELVERINRVTDFAITFIHDGGFGGEPKGTIVDEELGLRTEIVEYVEGSLDLRMVRDIKTDELLSVRFALTGNPDETPILYLPLPEEIATTPNEERAVLKD